MGRIETPGIRKLRCSFDEFDRPRAPCPHFTGVATAGRFCMCDCPYFHSFDRSNPMADFIKCGFPRDMRGPDFKPIKTEVTHEP